MTTESAVPVWST